MVDGQSQPKLMLPEPFQNLRSGFSLCERYIGEVVMAKKYWFVVAGYDVLPFGNTRCNR
jgi:hypothetical protein